MSSRKHVSLRYNNSTLTGLVDDEKPNEIMFCVFRNELEDLAKRLELFHDQLEQKYDHIQIYLADY